jgi:hypothetical protein
MKHPIPFVKYYFWSNLYVAVEFYDDCIGHFYTGDTKLYRFNHEMTKHCYASIMSEPFLTRARIEL